MKAKIFSLLLVIASSFSMAQVNWMSFEEVKKAMKEEPKKVIVDVYTSWCGPCKMMEARTFSNPQIASYINKNFYAVKFNAEGPKPVNILGKTFENPNYDPNKRGRNGTHQLTRAIANVNGRVAYPTVVYMDKNFNIITPVQGFMRPKQIEPILHFVVDEAYKDQEWEAYQESFESKL